MFEFLFYKKLSSFSFKEKKDETLLRKGLFSFPLPEEKAFWQVMHPYENVDIRTVL